ncbi:MAG: hypothetical protein ACLQGP_00160, partial [Isosphaeraceae bacterium]
MRPRPQGDATAARQRLPPLVGEPPCILIQQCLGVDAVAGERPAAEMVDEQVMGDGSSKPARRARTARSSSSK